MQKRNRLLGIFLALFILAGSAVAIAAFMIPSAEELLVQAIETTQAVTDGHAIAEFELDTPQQAGSGTLEAWGKLNAGPNGEPAVRVEVLAADEPELVGMTAVTDGTQFWVWHPSENKVLVGTLAELAEKMAQRADAMAFDGFEHDAERAFGEGEFDAEDVPETPEEAVAKLLEYFTASRTGTEDVGNNRVYTLRLVPIPEQMPDEVRVAGGFLNVWIRATDSAPVGIEYAEGAPGYAKAVATTLEINQGVDDSVFTFAIPEGAEVITLDDIDFPTDEDFSEAVPDFDVLSPAEVPAGAEAQETAVIRGAVVQRYSLDDGDFYVAQGPAAAAAGLFDSEAGTAVRVRGLDATLYSEGDGGRVLLTWVENGITYWVGGGISGEQALAIAESLQ